MSQAQQQAKFQCSACGKSYGWKPELAGKKVKCKCGAVMTVPAAATAAPPPPPPRAKPRDEADALYDLVPDDAPPPRKRAGGAAPAAGAAGAVAGAAAAGAMRCPSCGNGIAAGAVLCVNCGFNLKTGQKLGTAVGGPDTGAGVPPIARPAPGAAGALPAGMIVPPRAGPKQMQRNAHGTDEESKKKLIMMSVGGIVLIGLLVGGFLAMGKMSPREQLNAYDQEVQEDVDDMKALPVDEWMQYERFQLVGMDKKQAKARADTLLQMGAKQVLLPQNPGGMWMVAVLPDDPAARTKLIDHVNTFHDKHNRGQPTVVDAKNKYVQMNLPIMIIQ